jgi:hypothetical protein
MHRIFGASRWSDEKKLHVMAWWNIDGVGKRSVDKCNIRLWFSWNLRKYNREQRGRLTQDRKPVRL